MLHAPRLAALVALAIATALLAAPASAGADEDWVIQSFDIEYGLAEDGSIAVTESIIADFGTLERHGIIREIGVQQRYDEEHNRVYDVVIGGVDDGILPVPYTLSSSGGYLHVRIGNPDATVTGRQRYRIHYTIASALNPQAALDEFFWNATGHRSEVVIESATATVRTARPAIERVTCYEGDAGSTTTCRAQSRPDAVRFESTRPLQPGEGITIVVGLRKGVFPAPTPALVPAPGDGWGGRIAGWFEPDPIPMAIAVALGVLAALSLWRVWHLRGRDFWFGNAPIQDGEAEPKPWLAHVTVVVQYDPPRVAGSGRRLRPAEVGLLVDERADTLDVSATIVDLAVRKFLRIKEIDNDGVFGIFQSPDYDLERLDPPSDDLEPFERKLLGALFDGKASVKLSDLKGEFHEDLAGVKKKLYESSVKKLNLFLRNPEAIRNQYRAIGATVAAGGAGLAVLLGETLGAGLAAVPVALSGGGLVLLAGAMPRRTAAGWDLYRRCLGFKEYMVTAETDRQKFAEEANIFHEYLPYAIVLGCVDKWAKAFEGLEQMPGGDYYVGTAPFQPAVFSDNLRGFSTSISGVMAATPGGSGGSGFSGGFSGGGGGGGGVGSW